MRTMRTPRAASGVCPADPGSPHASARHRPAAAAVSEIRIVALRRPPGWIHAALGVEFFVERGKIVSWQRRRASTGTTPARGERAVPERPGSWTSTVSRPGRSCPPAASSARRTPAPWRGPPAESTAPRARRPANSPARRRRPRPSPPCWGRRATCGRGLHPSETDSAARFLRSNALFRAPRP